MHKILRSISKYVQKSPAKISGYLSAIILNASKYWTNIPVGLIIPIAMLLIMMGEGSQRLEDKKTLRALYTENHPQKRDEEILEEMLEGLTIKKRRRNVRSKRSNKRTKRS